MFICTPSQMKAAEENAVKYNNQTFDSLMENAAAAAVEVIEAELSDAVSGRILILCGKGNNGGDGFVMARLLADRGATVTVVLMCGEPVTGLAAQKLAVIRQRDDIIICPPENTDTDSHYDLAADAVFGTGFHGELSEDMAEFMKRVQKCCRHVIAVDIPSGADSVTGAVSQGTLNCEYTVAFGSAKVGMLLSPAREYCGRVIIREIGISSECFEKVGNVPFAVDDALAAEMIPQRGTHCHKGSFGRLLIAAGSRDMSGAAALNVTAALRSGAGLVRLASVRSVIDRVGASVYEATFTELPESESGCIAADSIPLLLSSAKGITAAAIGSGLTMCDDTIKLTREFCKFCGENNIPLIIDADGLNCMAGSIDIIRNANCKAVLTPHVGELARLLKTTSDEVMKDRLGAAYELSRLSGAVVCAKGMPTYIVSPDGRAAASFTGNGGLSRGGSGDVLTGIISGICTMNGGERLFECACAGVYIFGTAADIAASELSVTGMLPSDVIAQLPFAFRQTGADR